MKILVTGGRGFIGSHFVEEALKKNHTIVDIDKMANVLEVFHPFMYQCFVICKLLTGVGLMYTLLLRYYLNDYNQN